MPSFDALLRLARAVLARLTRSLLLAMVSSFLFVFIADEVTDGDATTFDELISRWSYGLHSPWLDEVMRGVTTLGNVPVLVGAVAIVAGWCVYKGRVRMAAVVAVVSLAGGLLNMLFKVSFARARPSLVDKLMAPESYSFPSGHAMGSMIVYGLCGYALGELYPRARIPIYLVAGLLAISIGFSRVYLGVHWPTDILAGFTAAGVILAATWYATKHAVLGARDHA